MHHTSSAGGARNLKRGVHERKVPSRTGSEGTGQMAWNSEGEVKFRRGEDRDCKRDREASLVKTAGTNVERRKGRSRSGEPMCR